MKPWRMIRKLALALGLLLASVLAAIIIKTFNGYYLFEIGSFITTKLQKKL